LIHKFQPFQSQFSVETKRCPPNTTVPTPIWPAYSGRYHDAHLRKDYASCSRFHISRFMSSAVKDLEIKNTQKIFPNPHQLGVPLLDPLGASLGLDTDIEDPKWRHGVQSGWVGDLTWRCLWWDVKVPCQLVLNVVEPPVIGLLDRGRSCTIMNGAG